MVKGHSVDKSNELPYFDKSALLMVFSPCMNMLATITSKRQLTIPSRMFDLLGFKEGQKVLVTEEDGFLVVKPAMRVINKLAGSVKVPTRFASLDIDEMIDRAKKEYHRGRV